MGVGTIPKNLETLNQTVRVCRPVAPRLSRSLRVIESDRDPSGTDDFLLTIHNNHVFIS